MITVVYGEFFKVTVGEFAHASPAHPRVHAKRFAPITRFTCFVRGAGFCNEFVQPIIVTHGYPPFLSLQIRPI
jgi:hypothetical protein